MQCKFQKGSRLISIKKSKFIYFNLDIINLVYNIIYARMHCKTNDSKLKFRLTKNEMKIRLYISFNIVP